MDQTSRSPPDLRSVEYLTDALDLIERSCKSFRDGHYPDYRVIAGQLRILLCDTRNNKDNSLALRVFPELRLHPMRNRVTPDEIHRREEDVRRVVPECGEMLTWIPATVTGMPEALRFVDVFDTGASPIPLGEWREQIGVVLGGQLFSLKKIIKSVAEKDGGSHVDDTPDEYLVSARKMHHKGPHRRATAHHEPMMIALGEYVVDELRRQLRDLGWRGS
jgi:hypothetical protein